jgi:hypothetical protein
MGQMLNRLKVVVCVVGLGAMTAQAASATQPSIDAGPSALIPPADGTTAPGELNDSTSGFPGARPFGLGRYARSSPGSAPLDWPETEDFMKHHSPVRLGVIEDLPEGTHKEMLKVIASRAFHNYQRTLKENPEAGMAMVRRVEKEDRVFELGVQLRSTSDASRRESLKSDLHQSVGELVDAYLKERQLRIDKLAETLKREQDRLAEDTKNRDQLVADKEDAVIKGKGVSSQDDQHGSSTASSADPVAAPTP